MVRNQFTDFKYRLEARFGFISAYHEPLEPASFTSNDLNLEQNRLNCSDHTTLNSMQTNHELNFEQNRLNYCEETTLTNGQTQPDQTIQQTLEVNHLAT